MAVNKRGDILLDGESIIKNSTHLSGLLVTLDNTIMNWDNFGKVEPQQNTPEENYWKRVVTDSFARLVDKDQQMHSYNLNVQGIGALNMKTVVDSIVENEEKKPKGDKPLVLKLLLCQNQLQDEGCRYLYLIRNVKELYLDSNSIEQRGCGYLCQCEWDLTELFLGYNRIGDNGIEHLASAHWIHLTKAYLYHNYIGPKGCLHLSKAPWHSLEVLILYENFIQDQGCKYLVKMDVPCLRQLDLGFNKIQRKGCRHLSKANWPHLQLLNFYENDMGDKGCSFLASSWPQLTEIDLRKNRISHQGSMELTKALWTYLKRIDMRSNDITNKRFGQLTDKCKIVCWYGRF